MSWKGIFSPSSSAFARSYCHSAALRERYIFAQYSTILSVEARSLHIDDTFLGAGKWLMSIVSNWGAFVPFLLQDQTDNRRRAIFRSFLRAGLRMPHVRRVWVDCHWS